MAKRYLYKVFDRNNQYLTTWTDVTFQRFRKQINSGLGELQLDLARKFDDFDEGASVDHGNIVEIWVVDRDTPARLIYSGYISGYGPSIDGPTEHVSITCLGFLTLYAVLIYKNGTSVTLTRNSYDPSNIVKDIVDRVRAEYVDDVLATKINYGANSIPLTGTTVSYTFTHMCLDALTKVQELAPSEWFFYVGADNILNFRQGDVVPTHTFTFKKDFKKIDVFKNMEEVRNQLLFWNGRDSADSAYLSRLYSNTTSKNNYGYRFEKATDGRVTLLTTADKWGNAFLAANKGIDIRASVEILDNNLDETRGYDIESIEPGDTCRFANLPTSASATFTENMLITSVEYTPTSVVLEVESQGAALERKLSKIKRDLEDQQYDNGQPNYTVV